MRVVGKVFALALLLTTIGAAGMCSIQPTHSRGSARSRDSDIGVL